MKKYAALVQEAITAARDQDWSAAIDLNTEVLERNPGDIGALNRTGLAYLQLGETALAKKAFETVISKDKSNVIAKKHLLNIKKKLVPIVSLNNVYFIEEPGKTKITELHRLTRKDVLSQLRVGQKCTLTLKNKHISVETEDEKYIGSLPDDLSFRLCKLIERGNEYECLIHTVTENSCSVHIREEKTSPKNKHLLSFPGAKVFAPQSTVPMDEEFLIEEDIPMGFEDEEEEILTESETNDFETTLEKINKGEEY